MLLVLGVVREGVAVELVVVMITGVVDLVDVVFVDLIEPVVYCVVVGDVTVDLVVVEVMFLELTVEAVDDVVEVWVVVDVLVDTRLTGVVKIAVMYPTVEVRPNSE